MENIVVTSTGKSAGKTSVIVGLAESLSKKLGYMKPFGDRLLYKKKRLWDYDAALVTEIFKLTENPEDITIGFEHSKLRYMYDEAGIKDKLVEISTRSGNGKDILFVESGMDLSYGASVNLDAINVAKNLNAKLVVVVSGDDGVIIDHITYLKKYVDLANVKFKGVIINKIHDVEDFKNTHVSVITKLGVPVLGVIPYTRELDHLTVRHLSECLFAKVIAGEGGLNNVVENIFVGAMSADIAHANPLFKKENKLIITSGDRSEMILTAIETNAVGIVLTNNILPPSNLISKAAEKNIPMFLVSIDTYQTAKQIDNIEPLLTREDSGRIEILKRLMKDHVNLKELA